MKKSGRTSFERDKKIKGTKGRKDKNSIGRANPISTRRRAREHVEEHGQCRGVGGKRRESRQLLFYLVCSKSTAPGLLTRGSPRATTLYTQQGGKSQSSGGESSTEGESKNRTSGEDRDRGLASISREGTYQLQEKKEYCGKGPYRESERS